MSLHSDFRSHRHSSERPKPNPQVEFKFNIGDKVFFSGSDCLEMAFETSKIYQGEIVKRSFIQDAACTPIREVYELKAGAESKTATVKVDKLATDPADILKVQFEMLPGEEPIKVVANRDIYPGMLSVIEGLFEVPGHLRGRPFVPFNW